MRRSKAREVAVETRVARVALPATCGELFQGTLSGVRCLVSCPIACYSVAEMQLKTKSGWEIPPDTPKAVAALHAGLAYLGCSELGGRLQLRSDLPSSRGYGSSTADVGATLYALGQALGQPLAADEVARLAVGVEPSDSTVFPGLALFDHRSGGFYEQLGPAPPLAVVILDPGGKVDTLAFNRLHHQEILRRLAHQHRRAFVMLREGLQRDDWETLGEAATISARAHQAILPNALLEPALTLVRDVGALGVCRAHSGTVLGLLLDPAHADVPAVTSFVARQLPLGVTVRSYPLVDGGPRHLVDNAVDRTAGIGMKPAVLKC